MPKQIVIDPVTRIEGHAKITIQLGDDGRVADAKFHVVEFRGFERFCEGRPMSEMAGITPRICGICPVSHVLASAKAGDEILAVKIPPPAEKLRRLMNTAQIVQSHALSFFYLSAPDFLLGWETPPERRNIFGMIGAHPELARSGIRLRQFGQEVIELLGGKKIHPAWAVPGGVRSPLTVAGRDQIRSKLPESFAAVKTALAGFKRILESHAEEIEAFGNFPSLFGGLVAANGDWEHYGGHLKFVDSARRVVLDETDPTRYREHLGEAGESSSYLKSPYYQPLGYPEGMYRVGPLARLNVCERMGTPQADRELAEFRGGGAGALTSSFLYHQARLIEILACLEHMERLLDDPDLRSHQLRADAGINQLRGVGVSEAPRGTLFHDYEVDENGLLKKVNFIIATGQNNLAMNRTVAQIARHYLGKGATEIPEAMLNRVEAGIRAFDPCLSCSTHAAGQMPMHLQLWSAHGQLLHETTRDGTH